MATLTTTRDNNNNTNNNDNNNNTNNTNDNTKITLTTAQSTATTTSQTPPKFHFQNECHLNKSYHPKIRILITPKVKKTDPKQKLIIYVKHGPINDLNQHHKQPNKQKNKDRRIYDTVTSK